MNKPNRVKNTRKTSLRMPEELARKVERLATADSRSFNQMVNILVDKAVSQMNKEQSDGANT